MAQKKPPLACTFTWAGLPAHIAIARSVYDRDLRAHNEQTGRRTEMGKGKFSFSEVFAESYKQRPRRDLVQAQRHYFMFDMAHLKPQKDTGAVSSGGFTWWSHEHQETLLRYRHGTICVLFDPNDRSKPVMVQDAKGRIIIDSLPCLKKGLFDSTEDARQFERGKAQLKKNVRRDVKALNLMTAAQLANIQRQVDAARPEPVVPASDTNVAKPVFGTPGIRAKASDDGTASAEMLRQQDEFNANVDRGLERLRIARMAS